ncbi:MAG: type II secretion system protein GspG [Thermoanaerobaculales bacterium]|nr:type II secretion system protein GspG [Thermoanaerobaculales bacterium]
MADIRTIGTAIEAYAVDNSTYPVVTTGAIDSSIAAYVEPTYVKRAPRNDGWNFPMRTLSVAQGYTVGGAARDKTFTNTALTGYTLGQTTNMDCDIMYSNGSFTVWPEGIQN